MKKRIGILLLTLCAFHTSYYGIDLLIGDADRFESFDYSPNFKLIPGQYGTYDLILSDREEVRDVNTDILLHFNGMNNEPWAEVNKIGPYEILSEGFPFLFDTYNKVLGESSAKFFRLNDRLVLKPQSDSFFSSKNPIRSFTISFYLNPVSSYDNETIFYKKDLTFESSKGTIESGIICQFKNHKIVFEFKNFFYEYAVQTNSWENEISHKPVKEISISSPSQVILKEWHHHSLTFDHLTGKLTYYLDGKEQRFKWITNNGMENGNVLKPSFHPLQSSNLVIGEKFSGNIDEFGIYRAVKEIKANPYSKEEQTIYTKVYDLGFEQCKIKNIALNHTAPKGSKLSLFYRLSNHYFTANYDEMFKLPYEAINPHSEFKYSPLLGRYLQFKIVVKADPDGMVSPVIQSLKVKYNETLPPAPPRGLVASAKNGKIVLNWRGNMESNLSGYKIYWGLEPGNYLASIEPDFLSVSEIENRIAPQYTLSGLLKDQVYYIAITAINQSLVESKFSDEMVIHLPAY